MVASSSSPVWKDPSSGAFVLGALGFCTGGLLAVAGLLVGIQALVRAARHPEANARMGRAIGAIAFNLGVLGIAAISIPSPPSIPPMTPPGGPGSAPGRQPAPPPPR